MCLGEGLSYDKTSFIIKVVWGKGYVSSVLGEVLCE